MRINNYDFRRTILFFSLLIFVSLCYFVWAFYLPVAQSPDEYMRNQIPFWIFRNGKLPVGNENELINPVWGFSYGFVPYFPSIVSALFIKVFSYFTKSQNILIFASRLPCVFAGIGTFIFCTLVGKYVFKTNNVRYLFSLFVCLLPQFCFLSSYLNNDNFTVFGSSIILLSWMKAKDLGWSLHNMLMLAIGISLIALSYYFAYSWILTSIFIFVYGQKNLLKTKKFIEKFIFVFFAVFILAGWYFIRNYFIYDGDFLGMRTLNMSGEKFAIDSLKPSNRDTFKAHNNGISYVLFHTSFVKTSLKSFICCFGYMNEWAPLFVYFFYFFILSFGIILFILRCMEHLDKENIYVYFALAFSIICPFLFSLYQSWSMGYQPQGRYLISALVPIMLFVSLGIDWFVVKFRKNLFIHIIGIIWMLLFCYCFIELSIGRCWSSTPCQIPPYKVMYKNFPNAIDNLSFDGRELYVSGWAFYEDAEKDLYVRNGKEFYKANKRKRNDISNYYGISNKYSGYSCNMKTNFKDYALYLIDKNDEIIYTSESIFKIIEGYTISTIPIKTNVFSGNDNTIIAFYRFDHECSLYVERDGILCEGNQVSSDDALKYYDSNMYNYFFRVSFPLCYNDKIWIIDETSKQISMIQTH